MVHSNQNLGAARHVKQAHAGHPDCGRDGTTCQKILVARHSLRLAVPRASWAVPGMLIVPLKKKFSINLFFLKLKFRT